MKQLHRLPTDQEIMDVIKHRRAIDWHYHYSFFPVNGGIGYWIDWCMCEQAPEEKDDVIFQKIKNDFDNILFITISIVQRGNQSEPIAVYYNPDFFTEKFEVREVEEQKIYSSNTQTI